MSRHIISSLESMGIEGMVLRHQMVYKGFEIVPHGGIRIFIQGKTR